MIFFYFILKKIVKFFFLVNIMVFVNLFIWFNIGNYNFFLNFLINCVGEFCKIFENLLIVIMYLIYLFYLMGLEKMIFKDCIMY